MRGEMAASHLTLKDIAREAGVSVATLDRVLHGRGECGRTPRVASAKLSTDTDFVHLRPARSWPTQNRANSRS